jgi:hypothetical protein
MDISLFSNYFLIYSTKEIFYPLSEFVDSIFITSFSSSAMPFGMNSATLGELLDYDVLQFYF